MKMASLSRGLGESCQGMGVGPGERKEVREGERYEKRNKERDEGRGDEGRKREIKM